ncbi:MAG: outer membrane lipoprotein-sorting protein [Candidatus Omnitrophota bacterium]
MKILFALLITGVLLISISSVYAEVKLTGDEIAKRVYERDDGDDSFATMDMVLIDKSSNQRKRTLTLYSKDFGKLSKNLIRFTSPADIEGTGFLSLENEAADDTQYLYLPDLGRSRRIVSSQKNLQFVNTDFTYEDMQRRKLDKDSHELIKEESFKGYNCYVVEYISKNEKDSQYKKIIQWIEKKSFVPVRIDFYNKKDELFKKMTVEKLEQIQGVWTAVDTVMEDFSGKHKTIISINAIKYDQGVEDDIFSVPSLENY